MYSQGKYIVGELKNNSIMGTSLTALCFNELISHDTFKHMFAEIHGAGFFWVNEAGEVVTTGKSISLGVNGRGEEDAFQIRRVLGLEPTY